MRLLSLDTSFSFINLTLIEEGRVLVHHCKDEGKKTLEYLPKVFKEIDIDPYQVDAYAVSLGVGYLTSLRIGITFIKTIAYLTKKPVVSYENLHMLCLFVKEPKEKVCALRVSNNVFYRVCREGVISPVMLDKGDMPELPVVSLSGQGIGGLELEYFPFSLYGGLWAYEKLRAGYEGDKLMSLEPLYLKPAV
jgi:tRNA A37 threonylcarbamoyladenosine modification protein TsaB